jgi:polyisoprenoid-binding protein YceI
MTVQDEMTETDQEKITDWVIDANHSTFEFSVRQVVVSTIKGAFSGVSGEVHFDPEDLDSSGVSAVVDISTLDTHHAGRDAKILGEGFFEVEKYPTATFTSTGVKHIEGDRYAVTGDFTLRGVTREVTFDSEFQGTHLQVDGIPRGAFIAKASINRSDYGFTLGNQLPEGGMTHSDEVKLAMYTTIKPKPVG